MKAVCAVALICFVLPLRAANPIPSARADEYIGKSATVCGKVVGTFYFETGGQLMFDKPYPAYTFTTFLPDQITANLGVAVWDYIGKSVCITGRIVGYHGHAEIFLTHPRQIKLQWRQTVH